MPGKLPWRSKGSPLQYSGLESSADCGVHGVAKGPPRLGDFDFDLAVFSPNPKRSCSCRK